MAPINKSINDENDYTFEASNSFFETISNFSLERDIDTLAETFCAFP